MKILVWLFRIAVFIALLGLAIKNDAVVDLRFYFEHSIQAPLSLILLGAFAVGVVVGLSAALATLIRQRIEIGRLQRSGKTTGTRD